MKSLYFAACLQCGVWFIHPASGKAVISVGMPFSEVEKLLYQYGAVPLWIGVSSPIDDIFPSYRLVDGRIFSNYGQKIADRSWTVSFIDEVRAIPFKSSSSYYYRRVTDLHLDEPEIDFHPNGSLRPGRDYVVADVPRPIIPGVVVLRP